jgi:hypothetical protein
MTDDRILSEALAILRQPGALDALRSVVQAQAALDAALDAALATRLTEAGLEPLPMVSVAASDPALTMIVDCSRRRAEMSETDAPASRCAWLAAPEIGGYRCRVCGRSEVETARAKRLDQVRGVRDGA